MTVYLWILSTNDKLIIKILYIFHLYYLFFLLYVILKIISLNECKINIEKEHFVFK